MSSLDIADSKKIPHDTARHYTTVAGIAYYLPSDEDESHRLTLQHHLLKRAANDQLIFAPVDFTSGDFILDCATGTGIWLLDVAKQAPETVQLIGFDIESRLFPEPTSLPSNVSFQVNSVLDLPQEWTNKFTLVHQRLLVTALTEDQWQKDMDELYRVTKPGGWVELCEAEKIHSEFLGDEVFEIFSRLQRRRGMSDLGQKKTQRIINLLAERGWVNIRTHQILTLIGGPNGSDGKENLIALVRALKTPVLEYGGLGIVNSAEEFDRLVEKYERVIDDKHESTHQWVVVWAQKGDTSSVV